MATVNPGIFINQLRLTIGDTNAETYRYTNDWLKIALEGSINALAKWWNAKYLLDEYDYIYRNPDVLYKFLRDEPPVVQKEDERPIILMAAIILLEGSLENSAWNIASWRDNEISVSNLEQSRLRSDNLRRLWDELNDLMLPPTKRLAMTQKQSLQGYKGNIHENETEY